ncbi:MAG: hypothetical protein ACOYN0_12795 [Phycisphaerales bacterium]
MGVFACRRLRSPSVGPPLTPTQVPVLAPARAAAPVLAQCGNFAVSVNTGSTDGDEVITFFERWDAGC